MPASRKPPATQAKEAEAQFYRELTRKTALERAELERREQRFIASQDNHRLYAFESAVNKGTVSECIAFLGQWFREEPDKPIKVVFNSPGGSVIDGLAMYDFIQQLRAEGATVNTASIGYAASMAGVLLQAGEERTMGRHAHLLIHEVSSGAIGKISEIEDENKFAHSLWDKLVAILAERSTLSERQIKRRSKRKDWWFDAEEALKHGFCDRIE